MKNLTHYSYTNYEHNLTLAKIFRRMRNYKKAFFYYGMASVHLKYYNMVKEYRI